jgi:hypothetical protein
VNRNNTNLPVLKDSWRKRSPNPPCLKNLAKLPNIIHLNTEVVPAVTGVAVKDGVVVVKDGAETRAVVAAETRVKVTTEEKGTPETRDPDVLPGIRKIYLATMNWTTSPSIDLNI